MSGTWRPANYESTPPASANPAATLVKVAASVSCARGSAVTLTRRKRALSEVCWLFGNWVREQAEAEGFPVVKARPHAALAERVLAAIDPG